MRPSLSPVQRHEQGFTLVELLVVIGIIAILTAIAVPMFLAQRQKAYTADLQSALKNTSTFATALGLERDNFADRTLYEEALKEASVHDKAVLHGQDGAGMPTMICATKDKYVIAGWNEASGKMDLDNIYYIGSEDPMDTIDWDDNLRNPVSTGRSICNHVLPEATLMTWATNI